MEQLFSTLPTRKISKGQILIYEGDPVENIFFIVGGYVKVFNILVDGTERTIVVYASGDAFPLTSFLSGAGVARYFYQCMTDVELKIMPQRDFQQKIKGDLEMGERLIVYTYKISQQFVDRIETLSARNARHKVAALLTYLATKAGTKEGESKVRLDIPLTTQDIADMCGLTRETTSVQLIKLKNDGVISGRRNLTLDMRKLQRLVTS